ncbi:hypothetical protein MTP03_43430 [Tsukamurella sp. PLM1]|nr:hypothetical protein MTP03_43430 [Tsukamurella sp. PLM1]
MQRAGGDVHVRDLLRDGLERAQRATELFALAQVVHGESESPRQRTVGEGGRADEAALADRRATVPSVDPPSTAVSGTSTPASSTVPSGAPAAVGLGLTATPGADAGTTNTAAPSSVAALTSRWAACSA